MSDGEPVLLAPKVFVRDEVGKTEIERDMLRLTLTERVTEGDGIPPHVEITRMTLFIVSAT